MRRGDVTKSLFTKKMLLKMSSFQIQSFMSSYRKISDISKKVFIKNGYRYIFTLINKFILKYPPKKNIEVTVYIPIFLVSVPLREIKVGLFTIVTLLFIGIIRGKSFENLISK